MIVIKGQTLKDIYYKLDRKWLDKSAKGIECTSNGYVVTLPEDAKGKKILIKFEE